MHVTLLTSSFVGFEQRALPLQHSATGSSIVSDMFGDLKQATHSIVSHGSEGLPDHDSQQYAALHFTKAKLTLCFAVGVYTGDEL